MNILPVWFIYVASLLRISGGLAYVRATIRGEAHPNPISWLLWSITPLISFAAAISEGFTTLLIMTLILGLSPLLVFIVSIIKNPRSIKFDRLNITCFLLALLGIGLWLVTQHPVIAIIFAIIADMISAIPTLAKTYRHPYSEFLPTYMINAFGMVLAILASEQSHPLSLAFPVYILLINTMIVLFISKARIHRSAQIKRGIARSKRKKTKR